MIKGYKYDRERICSPNSVRLVLWYLSCKLVYIVNIILQILIFEKMLRVDIFSYYSQFVKNLFVDVPEDAEMEVFPLLTYCEFPGEPQLHSYLLNFGVLCTLPINIYNEGVFHLLMTLYIVLFILLLFTIKFTIKSEDGRCRFPFLHGRITLAGDFDGVVPLKDFPIYNSKLSPLISTLMHSLF